MAGLGESTIRHLREGKARSPKVETLEKLAAALDTSPTWLAFGEGSLESYQNQLSYIQVKGEVAAGQWVEVTHCPEEFEHDPASIPINPSYPANAQYGLIVRGTSINRLAQDGEILVCIDIYATGLQPAYDDLVIVERCRDGGALCETTAKRYRPIKDGVELWPDSDDPRWQTPIRIDNALRDGDTVRILAIVESSVKSIRRGRR